MGSPPHPSAMPELDAVREILLGDVTRVSWEKSKSRGPSMKRRPIFEVLLGDVTRVP